MRFVCTSCQRQFTVAPATLARFPNWTPKTCMKCKSGRSPALSREENLTTAEVLEKYHGPRQRRVHGRRGDAESRPRRLGRGVRGRQSNHRGTARARAVHDEQPHGAVGADRGVQDGAARQEGGDLHGLGALREHAHQVGEGVGSARLAQEGRRDQEPRARAGAVPALPRAPGLELRWIKAHSGSRWNEYADSLATAYRREQSPLS